MAENKIQLSSLIAEPFYNVHKSICEEKHTHYWLKGGRGSTKSSFVSLEIVLGMMKYEQANAVVLRKIGIHLKDSVFEQIWWAISILGVEEQWEGKTSSPLEITYKKTGQKILFRGADNPRKIKSIKCRKGYIKYIWYEETDEFSDISEIRNINQSLMRGGKKFAVFYTYNPPKSKKNWVNRESEKQREDKYIHHSTYEKVPHDWLGEQFFLEAEHIKKMQPNVYRHEYMGEAIGTEGTVFQNVVLRDITEKEIATFDNVSRGLDWGYAVDPLHYTVNHYDKTRKKLYIYFEIQRTALSNYKAYEMIKNENVQNGLIVADSAEPKSIAEMQSYGLRIIGAKKGPDSVNYGIKWLQSLEEIVIDEKRCPETAREFVEYELEKDTDGSWKSKFPDKCNHAIDAVRYAREYDMRMVKVT